MHKIVITIIIILFSQVAFGQLTYYQMPNGRIIDSKSYQMVKENLAKNGKVEEILISKILRNDSIIIIPKLNVLSEKDINGKYIDPYDEQKKMIGYHFPIELFENSKGNKYSENFLRGKPTLINFWFTTCVPCVAELPKLNQLQERLKGKVNFFAITFDDVLKVKRFNQGEPFKYNHIVNAQAQINILKIYAYPTNLILNKDGIVVDVYGEINNSDEKVLKTLTLLML